MAVWELKESSLVSAVVVAGTLDYRASSFMRQVAATTFNSDSTIVNNKLAGHSRQADKSSRLSYASACVCLWGTTSYRHPPEDARVEPSMSPGP